MDLTGTDSVSKGVFVFKNGQDLTRNFKKNSKRKSKDNFNLLHKEITSQCYYKEYQKTWNEIKNDFDEQQKLYGDKIMDDLIQFIGESQNNFVDKNILNTAVLLTGINQPDHYRKFENLSKNIIERLPASSISIVQSRDCETLKSAMGSMVYGFVQNKFNYEELNKSFEHEHYETKRIQKHRYTMKTLVDWYNNQCPMEDYEKHLIIILPDFECFNEKILQDFILIISSYCDRLPFVLILGVATAISTLHNTLSYNVISKIYFKIFQTPSAITGLHHILDEIILSPKRSFHLSGKVMKFLTDIFLFYDFSINGFMQGFKQCLMEHFTQGRIYSLCCKYEELENNINDLKPEEDYESIRQLLSFRKYIESLKDNKEIILLLVDDNYFKRKLFKLLRDCYIYFKVFRCFLELILCLVEDLPKAPMGKHRSDLYYSCISKDITETEEFRECWQLLKFYAKEEFIRKLAKAIKQTRKFMRRNLNPEESDVDFCAKNIVKPKLNNLEVLVASIITATESAPIPLNQPENVLTPQSRRELRETLLKISKQPKVLTDFEKSIHETLDFVETEIIKEHFVPLKDGGPPLYELFVFSDLSTVRKQIIGAPRAALHAALNNPNYYLQCSCCKLNDSQCLLPTMPDLSIIYKLHLECGRLINLYDWMQAFYSVVDHQDDDSTEIDPLIQARFTNAVAELQFLGFIKTSKRKTDHVQRLTW